MMALIAMCSWDTEENGRSEMTNAALTSLFKTVDWSRHRLICVDNGSIDRTRRYYDYWIEMIPNMYVLYNDENKGQAYAINQAWKQRNANEFCVRCDNDIYFRTYGWVDRLEECIERDPIIGIIGLKHRDLMDNPDADDWQKTSLHALPHKKGERWLIVERIKHVLGSAQMVSPALLDKIGYLKQYGRWGYEDSDYAVRCELAGYYSCYYHGAEFEDLDRVKNEEYQNWKSKTASEQSSFYDKTIAEYRSGERSLYVGW